MRVSYFSTFFPLLPLVSTHAVSSTERMALLARQERQNENAPIKRLEDAQKGTLPNDNKPQPPPPHPPLEYEDHCADTNTYASFDWGRANSDIQLFCQGGIDLLVPTAPLWKTFDHSEDDINMKLQLGIQWSQRPQGQDDCHPSQNSNHIPEKVCVEQFLAAMNRCNTDTITKKYGQYPMTWNSPGGCVDFWLVGHGSDWSCDGQGIETPECKGGKERVGCKWGVCF